MHLQNWEGARQDLSQSQTIDFDEGTIDDLKLALDKCKELEAIKVGGRLQEEEKLKKRAEEIKKAREEAQKKSASSTRAPGSMGDMPGGMPGGMGGMPPGLMEALASDPELAAGMQNPKVIAAFTSLMSQPGGPASLLSNPAKMQELMADPEVGPILMKLMAKLGGGAMGGMGGMGGNMDGMAGSGEEYGDMPDLDDLPDLE